MENAASARAELLSRYLDGHLEGDDLASFERQLGQDASLRQELSQWKAMRNRLQGAVRSQPVPDDLAARVLERTTQRRGLAAFAGWRNLRLAAAAVFCLVLLASAWLYFRDTEYTVGDLPPQIAALMRIGVGKHVSCVKERIASPSMPLGKYNSQVPEKYREMLEAAQRALPGDFKLVELHICGSADRRFAHLTLTRGDGYLSVFLTERRDGDPVPNDPHVASASVGNIEIYAARQDDMQVGVFALPADFAFVVSDYPLGQNLEFAKEVAEAIR